MLLLKADCLVQMGEYKRAADLLAPLESTHAEERVFNYVYGMALLQDGRTEAGLKQIDRILKDGDSAEAHLMMGISQRLAADYGAARDEFKRAIDAEPRFAAGALLVRADAVDHGDREGARQAFEQELASNPSDFDANLYTGVILKEEQRIDEARRFFERALAGAPGRSRCALPDGDDPSRDRRQRARARGYWRRSSPSRRRSSKRTCRWRPSTTA